MHIRAKLYPYPVLASFNNDYLDSDFDINCQEELLEDSVKITFIPQLNNNGLEKLIKNGDASFVVHVESSLTSFRKAIFVPENGSEITIPVNSIESDIFICPFIVARNKITGYTNESFNADYEGVSFDFDKGSILAIGTEQMFTVEKENHELDHVESIFSVIEIKDPTFTDAKMDFNGHKIVISLPSNVFKKFIAQNNSNPTAVPVLHSMLIIPSLIKALEEVKHSDDYYIYETRKWYKSIQKACLKSGINMDEESIKAVDSFEISQLIMGNATCNGICNLNKIALVGGDTDED